MGLPQLRHIQLEVRRGGLREHRQLQQLSQLGYVSSRELNGDELPM